MLKLAGVAIPVSYGAAAFGRLCVETAGSKTPEIVEWQPPSGGCVLKPVPSFADTAKVGAAAFGRLCVETKGKKQEMQVFDISRLRAAVC